MWLMLFTVVKMQDVDPELAAMSAVLVALSPLDRDTQERVLKWASSKLGHQMLSNAHGERREESDDRRPSREGTINTVSARLNVQSCRDLFRAAAFHLTLYQGKDRFSRAEWVACAKEARQWKTDYSTQMATTITRLLNSGFVNETAKEVYVVTDEALREAEAALG